MTEERLNILERRVKALYSQRLEERIHDLEEELDTFVKTAWWKKVWFVVDGWPLYHLIDHPQWRPWHRWTRR